MGQLGAYILSVTAAALACAIATKLLGKQGTAASVGKILVGLFLLFCLISPLHQMGLADLPDWPENFAQAGKAAASEGEAISKAALAQVIKTRTEAYIVNKASALQADITVELTLSSDALPVPVSVTISGSISPYAKGQLQRILEEDLGIGKEAQTWR